GSVCLSLCPCLCLPLPSLSLSLTVSQPGDIRQTLLAVYNPAFFGSGSKLAVIGPKDEIQPPKVFLYDASHDELRTENWGTLVCLVSEFYPDTVEIEWKIDGALVKNEDSRPIHTDLKSLKSKSSSTYSVTSRLRLSVNDWADAKLITCRVTHFGEGTTITNHEANVEPTGELCAFITKDDIQERMVTGKLTYLILLCKSILFGVFISFVVWKIKSPSGKRFD
uniref:Ig-like domain-containing protein n=1 Tax=Callorhinchus milii TaxID=7868 RepID=A0A4W3HFG8_CALMI